MQSAPTIEPSLQVLPMNVQLTSVPEVKTPLVVLQAFDATSVLTTIPGEDWKSAPCEALPMKTVLATLFDEPQITFVEEFPSNRQSTISPTEPMISFQSARLLRKTQFVRAVAL